MVKITYLWNADHITLIRADDDANSLKVHNQRLFSDQQGGRERNGDHGVQHECVSVTNVDVTNDGVLEKFNQRQFSGGIQVGDQRASLVCGDGGNQWISRGYVIAPYSDAIEITRVV